MFTFWCSVLCRCADCTVTGTIFHLLFSSHHRTNLRQYLFLKCDVLAFSQLPNRVCWCSIFPRPHFSEMQFFGDLTHVLVHLSRVPHPWYLCTSPVVVVMPDARLRSRGRTVHWFYLKYKYACGFCHTKNCPWYCLIVLDDTVYIPVKSRPQVHRDHGWQIFLPTWKEHRNHQQQQQRGPHIVFVSQTQRDPGMLNWRRSAIFLLVKMPSDTVQHFYNQSRKNIGRLQCRCEHVVDSFAMKSEHVVCFISINIVYSYCLCMYSSVLVSLSSLDTPPYPSVISRGVMGGVLG